MQLSIGGNVRRSIPIKKLFEKIDSMTEAYGKANTICLEKGWDRFAEVEREKIIALVRLRTWVELYHADIP